MFEKTIVPASDLDETTPEGKTSSVHFLKFDLSPAQVHTLKNYDLEKMGPITVGVGHIKYPHAVSIGPALLDCIKKELA